MIVRDGIYYALGSFAAGLAAVYFSAPLAGVPFFVFGVFCLYFFRDPEREIPGGPVAVSPADGKVVAVHQDSRETTRVSIFLNIFDVHVNRAPVAGTITGIHYKRGQFLVASKERASLENEQNVVTIEGEGTRVTFKQIAGLIARRIVFRRKVGEAVGLGERVGLIKFGSRVDVLLGPEWEISVARGQRVRAGSTVLARRRS